MATRKSRRSKKRHAKTDKNKKSKRHRIRTAVSWKDHYTYESSVSSFGPSTTNKNNGNIFNGLRDFLALKKDKK